jgi:hypothetical protein
MHIISITFLAGTLLISTISSAAPISTADAAAIGNIITLVFVNSPAGWRIAHAHDTTMSARAAARDPAKTVTTP